MTIEPTAAYGHPYGFARALNEQLLKKELPAGAFIGWIALDFASAPLAAHIYETNF